MPTSLTLFIGRLLAVRNLGYSLFKIPISGASFHITCFKQLTKRACRNNAGAKARRPRSATCVSSQPRCAHRLSGKNPSLIRTKREAEGGDVARAPPCLAPAIARLDAEPLPGSLPTPFRRPGQSHPSPHPPFRAALATVPAPSRGEDTADGRLRPDLLLLAFLEGVLRARPH